MQFTTIISAALLSVVAIAAPAPGAMSMAASGPQWTITGFNRPCNSGDTQCTYNFGINKNDGSAVTKCSYTATGSPASRASVNGVKCGAFTVSSNWSGQFGAGNGFTTLAVVSGKQIVYPAYTDKQLAGGKTVSPDQSYPVNNLPN